MYTSIKITENEVLAVLSLVEDHFNDLKSKRIQPSKLSESISSFANTSGGELYLGIEEQDRARGAIRQWNGFNTIEEANAHIQVLNELAPLENFYDIDFLEHPILTVLSFI